MASFCPTPRVPLAGVKLNLVPKSVSVGSSSKCAPISPWLSSSTSYSETELMNTSPMSITV
eukprot:1410147-Rhodomonas_salina.1